MSNWFRYPASALTAAMLFAAQPVLAGTQTTTQTTTPPVNPEAPPTADAHAPMACPLYPEVLAQAQASQPAGHRISTDALANKIGLLIDAGVDLHLIANRLKNELPNAQPAEIADIMIAAYCQYLNAVPRPGQNRMQMFTAFEAKAYDAAINPPNQTPLPGGWLYN